MLKFAHVAFPIMLLERQHGIIGEADLMTISLPRHLLYQALRNMNDVFAALPQRRQVQDKTFEAEIEIFTKPAFRDAALEILIGGGDDADIDGGGSCGADTIKGLFL